MVADAAVGDDGLGRHASAPLQRAQLPAASTKAGFKLGNAHLTRPDADFGRIRAPVFQVNHRLGRAHITGDYKAGWQMLLDIANHVFHAVSMPVGDIDGDVVGREAQLAQPVHGVVIGLLDA